MKKCLAALLSGFLSIFGASAEENDQHHDHADHSACGIDGAAGDGAGSYFEPFEHLHFSPLGTPILHPFGIEPALTGRDFFTTYRYRSGDGLEEHEVEWELEWAFTKRLGIIVEMPYVFEREGGESNDGFGDIAVVPRALVVDRDRFLLTAQLEIVAPTGTNGFGGSTALAPGFANWIDLGHNWTLNSQVAVEHVFDEDINELIFGFGLLKSFGGGGLDAEGHVHGHATSGLNLHLEIGGAVGLSGEDSGAVELEGLVGLSYQVNSKIDLRAGVEFPLSSPRGFDAGLVTGFVWHF